MTTTMLTLIPLVAPIPYFGTGTPIFGGFTNIDVTPGSEAYRIASYGIMNLRNKCNTDNSIVCKHIADFNMYNVISAKKQLVNGFNVNMTLNTTIGTLNMNVHYSTDTIEIYSFYKDVILPTLNIDVPKFEKVVPPCTPKTDGCMILTVMPVCVNGITYLNPCLSKMACRVDYKLGKCNTSFTIDI